MANYIDRRAAIYAVHKSILDFFYICNDDEESPMTYKDERLLELNKAIATQIKAVPSADVQPVVRCKNCKHSYVFEHWEGINAVRYCKIFKNHYGDADMCVEDDDFCSHGERRNG